jgi:hypothetical protein
MIKAWEKQQGKYPEAVDIIQMGIDKLGAYRDRVEGVPAYIFAMSEFLFPFACPSVHRVSSYKPGGQAQLVRK